MLIEEEEEGPTTAIIEDLEFEAHALYSSSPPFCYHQGFEL